ncbi:MAG TPA: toprim domain-containing protein [Bacillota bacterium]|nr:toprim domain-containing protein [Bacillota bacterium]
MADYTADTIIIVEGITDKQLVEQIIAEHVTILCTFGTFDIERFDHMLETYNLDHKEVFILVDEDYAGIELRKQLANELPHAKHIYISEEYGEVARTPANILATTLASHHIAVNPFFLDPNNR